MLTLHYNLLLIWLTVVFIEAGRHVYLIKIKKVSPNKVISWLIRAIICAVLLYLEYKYDIRPMYVVIPAYIISAWFLHDSILALSMGRKVWYLNSTGPIDRAQSGYGPYIWIFKAIAAVTLVGMYFVNYES